MGLGAGDTNNLPTVLKPKIRGYMRFMTMVGIG